MRDYHGHQEVLGDAAHAAESFDEQANSIMPDGRSGQAIWFGPQDGEPELRVDVDVDAGRAALRWLADGSYAVELTPADPIVVLESPDGGAVTVPAELARVSPETARRAVVAYVESCARPAVLRWQPPS
jgi:hypothetical protein